MTTSRRSLLRVTKLQLQCSVFYFLKPEGNRKSGKGWYDLESKNGYKRYDRLLEEIPHCMCYLTKDLLYNTRSMFIPRLQDEVDAKIGQKSTIDFEDLGKLEYCSCVLKETLRLYPPSTMTFRELVKSHTVDGYNIPRGTVMVV